MGLDNKCNRRYFSKQLTACFLSKLLPLKYLNTMIPKGVTIRKSKYTVKETIDRLHSFLQEHGATVYARINQQAEVNNAGGYLLPLEFILFGNPVAGGGLMNGNPMVALDLPLKVIAWEDDDKNVWLAYNEGSYLEERYAITHQPGSPLFLDQLIDKVFNP
jgi:uncharacterized protein (DUF302 family)